MNATTSIAPRRRLLSFRLRDLLWLTAVIALGLGWWLDHRKLQAKVDATTDVQGHVTLDFAPLKTGRITFTASNGRFIGGTITDGEYHLAYVPLGRYDVRIEVEGVDPWYESWPTRDVRSPDDWHDFGLQSAEFFKQFGAPPPP